MAFPTRSGSRRLPLNSTTTGVGPPKGDLTLFGNMVALLSEQGNAAAMAALERLWNRLTHHLPFLTICGYPASCFNDGVPDLWSRVCAEHRVLSHAKDV